MGDILSWLSQYGGWGLLAVVVILIILFYDRLERPIARVYDLFSWAGTRRRRQAIKADIQSSINLFSRSMDKEVPNTMPYDMNLQLVGEDEIESAEVLRNKNLVLVRIRDRRLRWSPKFGQVVKSGFCS